MDKETYCFVFVDTNRKIVFSLKQYDEQYLKDGNVNAELKKKFADNKLSLSNIAKVSK